LGRILALDYGAKRTGIAVTDPLQITANNLGAVETKNIWNFLAEYFLKEKIEALVIGYPVQMSGEGSESLRFINPFIQKFRKTYPAIPVELADERFTSKMASMALLTGGAKKKDRQNKGLVDSVSAVIILQGYLDTKRMKI
jgi:putative Holliday junction resolvase